MVNKEYMPLEQAEPRESDEELTGPQLSKPRSRSHQAWVYAIILILVLANTVQLALYQGWKGHEGTTTTEIDGFSNMPTVDDEYRQFWWNTDYSSTNQTFNTEMWEAIVWTHGMIAVDKTWAATQDWPSETLTHPRFPDKGVYLLEAYHEVHCLGVLRRVMKETFDGSPPSKDDPVVVAHVAHCFDYLLQVTMCNADSTPLYVTDGTKVGHGQAHQCKNWSQLRQYATDNSACFDDRQGGLELKDHFEFCSDDDGLVIS